MCVSLAYVYIITCTCVYTCTCINVTHFCGIMHLAYIIYIYIYIEGGGLVVGVRESEVCVFVCVWVI